MKASLRLLAVLVAIFACVPSTLWAVDLYGSAVTGGVYFNGGGINYFDPANGFVPAGYGNSAPNGPVNVVIADWGEFAFSDGANFLLANFTHNELIISDFSTAGALAPTKFTFEDPIFTAITFDSSNFPGTVSASIMGDIITVELSGFSGGHVGLFNANWAVNQVPEPGTIITLASGLLGAAAFARKRWIV